MDTTGFRKLRLAVQEAGRPAESWYARRVQRAMEGAFERAGLFSEFELGRTDDLDRMVIGVCRCADGVLPWEAGTGVEQIWRTAVLDAHWESHAVACTDSLMEFEGAVTFDETGHYVTVHVVAEPATVPEPEPQPAPSAEPAMPAELASREAGERQPIS
ncbi:hypothetical protein [Knoellia koreensis]|uniref:Uncharacterized protein n=1 Tax=Knoellia koreensis TaxID=2730921 RepID=A0A849HIG8_9MICO|nr:hypothetical protein [Knoellia sp. DB2414S]NNM46091.1 hypothetical protein [Knoellia sp. DB2414S]